MSFRAAAVRRRSDSGSAKSPTFATSVRCVDPLSDRRWPEFLEHHPEATVFHTPGWLEALRRTYGYLPVVFTTAPPEANLTNGIVCCRVRSWLTGSRLVSVPFSDHCQPLIDNGENFAVLVEHLQGSLQTESWRYIEFRPLSPYDSQLAEQSGFARSEQFVLHKLDLRDSLEKIFGNFHKKSTQDKIHRAEREKLDYEEGNSSANLAKFYHLQLLTRRRHQLPPQPLGWFRTLLECMGDSAKIRVASKDGQPIAGTITLSYKGTVVAKYGCSDSVYHRVGAMPFLLWKAIQEGKRQGALEYDFGRSEPENTGLLNFKSNWGAGCSSLSYFRYPSPVSNGPREHWGLNLAKNICGRLPNPLLTAAGGFLYKHIG
jgi:CelD/BcsL family acetyltransferase involved in cellulose biosynthesis